MRYLLPEKRFQAAGWQGIWARAHGMWGLLDCVYMCVCVCVGGGGRGFITFRTSRRLGPNMTSGDKREFSFTKVQSERSGPFNHTKLGGHTMYFGSHGDYSCTISRGLNSVTCTRMGSLLSLVFWQSH